jgi:hypothetical protein
MNQVTYHHYGATILNAPIAQLRRDIHAIFSIPSDLVRTVGHTAAVLEEAVDCGSGSHMLSYRSTLCAPELAEYCATYKLASVADAPHTTFVEWTRDYRPAEPVGRDQVQPLVSSLIDQDRALASRFSVEYGSAEVFYIDYTLGCA